MEPSWAAPKKLEKKAQQMVASVIYLFTLHHLTPVVVCNLLPVSPPDL